MTSRFRLLSLASSAFVGALSVVASSGAWADSAPSDHPALAPTRDVVVTYRFKVEGRSGASKAQTKEALPEGAVNVSYGAEGNRLRIDPIGKSTVTILDRIAQRMTLIDMGKRSYIQLLPMNGLSNPFMLNLNMTFHAEEMGKIAGHDCRYWSVESPKGKAKACVTEDGVILLEVGVDADGVQGRMEATEVSYRDLPQSTFEPPADFRRIQPQFAAPQGQPGEPVPGAEAGHGAHQGVTGHPPVDTSQPSVSNDSASDGSVNHSDQPSSAVH